MRDALDAVHGAENIEDIEIVIVSLEPAGNKGEQKCEDDNTGAFALNDVCCYYRLAKSTTIFRQIGFIAIALLRAPYPHWRCRCGLLRACWVSVYVCLDTHDGWSRLQTPKKS